MRIDSGTLTFLRGGRGKIPSVRTTRSRFAVPAWFVACKLQADHQDGTEEGCSLPLEFAENGDRESVQYRCSTEVAERHIHFRGGVFGVVGEDTLNRQGRMIRAFDFRLRRPVPAGGAKPWSAEIRERRCLLNSSSMEIAVCLVSGGMDSCVAAAEAVQREFEPAFFHAGYGQRTEKRERAAFDAIADHYRVKRRLAVDLSFLARVGGSALTDRSVPVPENGPARTQVPVTYVPFRNGLLLSAASGWAEALGATRLYIGAVEADGSGYPDCRREFFEAFQKALNLGTRKATSIRIETPLIGLLKTEIVTRGLTLGAPLHLTWSCYQATDLACGRCDSCRLRRQGFSEAGRDDPIPYQPSKVKPAV